jgi:hypothetical protein
VVINPHPHFVATAGPLEMHRAMKARLLINQTKIIQVFERRQLLYRREVVPG